MKLKTLAMVAGLMVATVPVFAAHDGQTPTFVDLNRKEEQIKRIPTQRIVNSIQDRLPQAEIANLLTQIEDACRGTGSIPAAEAGRLEEELARQKQFWFDEYQKSLGKGVAASTAESFVEGPAMGKEFDDLFTAALAPDPNDISPESLKLIYQEYDNLSQTFQQMKLARFLSASREGIQRYGVPKPDRTETASIAEEIDHKYLPVYQQRVQDGVTTLRKILVATKPATGN
ncbi:MAG: hypothetical protein HY303_07655 [Candidatus Wallbacteria bacterium]|nr:hypothetical protein [Candidatus Wallbacteria bacterium]